jgi:hypothetical protein
VPLEGRGRWTAEDRWPSRPDLSRTSLLLRYARAADLFEWALIGGTRDYTIVGGSLQGELAAWLGIRAEGHHAVPEREGKDSYLEFSLGLERRFENSLDVRIEQFYHGNGYDSIEEAGRALAAGRSEGDRLSSPDNSRVEVAGYARRRVFRYTKICGMPDNAAEPVTSTRFM